ncbi:LysR substrate-binding domain-containing protein [Piscinibacter terrae]|uniref:LysR family transcriptional regulator n=1 Tax=Piscinibacter terrae TaxID=2496871 RepID=A0A3N7K6V8_9BURK|nr:LysR substrate-binding domain-containing protein [Albitalea terrae]RQP26605.1 LysR family transcriptional regulator [Albitalea terrae]
MNTLRHRALSLGNLRAFEAVARRLNFSEAAEELHVTQSAISRQIKGLEDELGAPLFTRGTRHVELTSSGTMLLRVVAPWLDRLDASVRQIRQSRGRRAVHLTTFPSFASLWLLPQIEAFQRDHPDLDIRVSANDRLVDLDDPEIDIALRHCTPQAAPAGAQRMFGEVMTPVISRALAEDIRQGKAPKLDNPSQLADFTLIEEDDHRPSGELLSWRPWLTAMGHRKLQPRRWLYLNYTYQQVQAALAGQGVGLARLALVAEQLGRGDLVEPFGQEGRTSSPYAYWLITTNAGQGREEVKQFADWVNDRAADTRHAIGEVSEEDLNTESD